MEKKGTVSVHDGGNMPNIIIENYLDGEQIRDHLVRSLVKNQGGFKLHTIILAVIVYHKTYRS